MPELPNTQTAIVQAGADVWPQVCTWVDVGLVQVDLIDLQLGFVILLQNQMKLINSSCFQSSRAFPLCAYEPLSEFLNVVVDPIKVDVVSE